MNIRFFYVSFTIHLMILSFISLSFVEKNTLNNTENIIQAFISQSTSANQTPLPLWERSTRKARRVRGNLLLKPTKPTPEAHSATQPSNQQPPTANSPKSTPTQELLKLLHNQIASHQKYPDQALYLNQSGTVTLHFNLSPTGELTNLTVLKSSGFSSLDQAALTAVNAIAPIREAHLYLQHPETFSINVTFQG